MKQFAGQSEGEESETKKIQQVRCSLHCLAALERRKCCPFREGLSAGTREVPGKCGRWDERRC